MIIHQLEWTFQQKDWLLELPETIEQQNISNDETMHVLHKHQSNFDSDDFCHDFLETTPNGKSIVRVAQDLGLKIDHLTVKHYDKEVDKIVIDETTGTLGFSVIAHVIPDPSVYGA